MSSLKLIGQTVFKLESGNHTRTDGRRTHQSNRRIGYTQPAQQSDSWISLSLFVTLAPATL